MIRRKDSFGFIDFVKGKYSLSNLFHIKNSIDQMSQGEKQLIRDNVNHFDNIWFSFYDLNSCNYSKRSNNYYNSYKKFEALKKGTLINGRKYTLESLLNDSVTNWQETEWEFPKGRKLKGESDIECALREFEEETGFAKDTIEIVNDMNPFEEIFLGSNHRAYKHKYFPARLKCSSLKPLADDFQRSEVSKLEWKTFEECLQSMRPYNYEKKRVLNYAHQTLNV
jgi:8-oxo-dGTP pyrophosphatase MutT (NUDIX family)